MFLESVGNTIGRFVAGLWGPRRPPAGPEQSGCALNTGAVSPPRVASITQAVDPSPAE